MGIAWFIIGFCVLALVIVGGLIALKFLSKEEKKFMEVSDHYLSMMGKSYSKNQYASTIYNLYIEVLNSVVNENYTFLREVLSDEIYNNYLVSIKNEKDRKVKTVVEKFKPNFSKLVSLVVKDDLEVAKVWVKYSYVEYTIDLTPNITPDGEVIKTERIINGSKDKKQEKEYMLTLVKSRTEKESVACPSCGFVTKILTKNYCDRCGAGIVSKKYHWVFISKEEIHTNM